MLEPLAVDPTHWLSYDVKVGQLGPALRCDLWQQEIVVFSSLLPSRSMVGQLPLEQYIGVRIPGGQPYKINTLKAFLVSSILAVMEIGRSPEVRVVSLV